jgi:hypothetical protein
MLVVPGFNPGGSNENFFQKEPRRGFNIEYKIVEVMSNKDKKVQECDATEVK